MHQLGLDLTTCTRTTVTPATPPSGQPLVSRVTNLPVQHGLASVPDPSAAVLTRIQCTSLHSLLGRVAGSRAAMPYSGWAAPPGGDPPFLDVTNVDGAAVPPDGDRCRFDRRGSSSGQRTVAGKRRTKREIGSWRTGRWARRPPRSVPGIPRSTQNSRVSRTKSQRGRPGIMTSGPNHHPGGSPRRPSRGSAAAAATENLG